MRQAVATSRLLVRSQVAYEAELKSPHPFITNAQRAGIAEHEVVSANRLASSIKKYPHAFVIGCLMDRRINANSAWAIPYKIRQTLGTFDFQVLHAQRQEQLRRFVAHHPLANVMARNLRKALDRIADQYDGHANRIWAGEPSSAEVVYRFLLFPGIGPKIATMAANILVRDLKVTFGDYSSIDVSIDVHVNRVLKRLGLIDSKATREQAIYKTRSMHPEFPGKLDLALWQIGSDFCKPRYPNCDKCYMADLCPSANWRHSLPSQRLKSEGI